MKKIEHNYKILNEFLPSNARNAESTLGKKGNFVDNWYVYTTHEVYNILFGKKIQGKEKLPWKRKVVKIYSKETKCSVYRIWRGTFRTVLSKDILYVDKEAKYILSSSDSETSIILSPSNKFSYYWNHFAPEIRAPFKLGFVSFLISFISLILALISFNPLQIKVKKDYYSEKDEISIIHDECNNNLAESESIDSDVIEVSVCDDITQSELQDLLLNEAENCEVESSNSSNKL